MLDLISATFLQITCNLWFANPVSVGYKINTPFSIADNGVEVSIEARKSEAEPITSTAERIDFKEYVSIPYSYNIDHRDSMPREADIAKDLVKHITGASTDQIVAQVGPPQIRNPDTVLFPNRGPGCTWLYFVGHSQIPIAAEIENQHCKYALVVPYLTFHQYVLSKVSQFGDAVGKSEAEILEINAYPTKVYNLGSQRYLEYNLGWGCTSRLIFENGVCVRRESLK